MIDLFVWEKCECSEVTFVIRHRADQWCVCVRVMEFVFWAVSFESDTAHLELKATIFLLMLMSCMDAMYLLRAMCLCLFMGVYCRAFELQDMIHTLIEENIHLHDQLENLTAALRELRQLLLHHSSGIYQFLCISSLIEKNIIRWILWWFLFASKYQDNMVYDNTWRV